MSKRIKAGKVGYNIEYAHIYADKLFGKEQQKSIKELRKTVNRLKRLNKNYVLTVLIDEYSPSQNRLSIKQFLDKLDELKSKPDYLAFESQLAPYKDLLLKEMKGKIKKEYKTYIKKHGKIPCSLLIAIWYLKRLGLIKAEKGELTHLSKNNKPFPAKKIITILPKKYQIVEIKALKIIRATRFKKYSAKISNIFFD